MLIFLAFIGGLCCALSGLALFEWRRRLAQASALRRTLRKAAELGFKVVRYDGPLGVSAKALQTIQRLSRSGYLLLDAQGGVLGLPLGPDTRLKPCLRLIVSNSTISPNSDRPASRVTLRSVKPG